MKPIDRQKFNKLVVGTLQILFLVMLVIIL